MGRNTLKPPPKIHPAFRIAPTERSTIAVTAEKSKMRTIATVKRLYDEKAPSEAAVPVPAK
jgi:hypothetical protein